MRRELTKFYTGCQSLTVFTVSIGRGCHLTCNLHDPTPVNMAAYAENRRAGCFNKWLPRHGCDFVTDVLVQKSWFTADMTMWDCMGKTLPNEKWDAFEMEYVPSMSGSLLLTSWLTCMQLAL